MPRVPVKVVLDTAHLNDQAAVCRAVSDAGLQVEQVIPEIGAIYGSAEEASVDRIGRIDGVLRAQRERGYQLPPFSPHIPQ